MPYKHEHAARIIDPSEFDDFRRENDALAPGVHVIYGARDTPGKRGGHTEIQAIRFAADVFSPSAAQKWLEDNDIEYLSFHPATQANPREPAWLPLRMIHPALPYMEQLGVSEVARSTHGFLPAYERANGDPRQLGDSPHGEPWRDRRNNFIARHFAQVEAHDEPLWDADGNPTRRHLALVAWAWTPERKRWERWLTRIPRTNPVEDDSSLSPVQRAIKARNEVLAEMARRDQVKISDRQVNAIDRGVHEYTAAHWGVAPNAVYEVQGHIDLPRNQPVIEMGKLRELWVKPPGAKPYILQFDDNKTMLCFTRDKAQRLHIVLADHDRDELIQMTQEDYADSMPTYMPLPDVFAEVGGRQANYPVVDIEVIPLGRLTHVVYLTEKRPDGVSEYKHKMGEHGGIEPVLCIDDDGYLYIAGGTYSVPNRGIIY